MLLPHFEPCQQDPSSVLFFACTVSVSACPTAPPCRISMRRCAALRDDRRASNWFARASLTSAAGINQCVLLHSVCNSACTVEGRIAARMHQSTNVQRRSGLHTAPATLVARPAPVDSLHSWGHCGWLVVHERRSLRPLMLRCVCNSACDGRIAAPVDMPMQWNTRKPSQPALVRCV